MDIFLSASSGTEEVLRDEVFELGMKGAKTAGRGVRLAGSRRDAWKLCLYSRIAQRVMVPAARFQAPDEASLYAGVHGVNWYRYAGPGQTLGVSAFCHDSALTHSGFVALKTKDAVVDRIRDECGDRPDVDRRDPDLKLFVHLVRNRATVYLDLSGAPLFQRGYRREAGPAPLKETLAAALLRFSEWDGESPLADPMCGSGTIPIEAGLQAGNMPPGVLREQFGFERWRCHGCREQEEMAALRSEAFRRAHRQSPTLIAADADADALEVARRNARLARVRIRFRHTPIEKLQLGGRPGTVVVNPPYNERLAADEAFYRRITAAFSRMHGWRVCVLSGSPELERIMPLVPARRYSVHNGALPCEVLVYDIP